MDATGLAWSLDDDDELVWPRPWTLPVAVLMAAVALLAALVPIFGHELATADAAKPPAVASPAVVPTSPAVSAPPRRPVTIPPIPSLNWPNVRHEIPPRASAPATIPAPIKSAAADRAMLASLRSLGYVITDPAAVISEAHEFCQLLRDGDTTDQANNQLQAQTGMDASDTLQLTSSAMLTEPNCY